MAEKKKVRAGVIVGLALVAGGIAFAIAKARAAPPEGYQCPYCLEVFATYEELVTHVQTSHPGQRIPLPIEWE